LLGDARSAVSNIVGSTQTGTLIAVGAFFGGYIIAALIDKLIPETENPHGLHSVEEMTGKKEALHTHALHRMGVITAIAIAIHNFPEGIATFFTGLDDTRFGIAVAIAVAIHNIPEGIAVSVPIYYSTGSRRKAFWFSLMSGLAEPLGAVVAYSLLMQVMSPIMMQCILAAVAGIMVFISLDELLPAARQYGRNHLAILGIGLGMAIMAGSLIIMM